MNQAAANKARTIAFVDAMNRSDADAIADTYAENGRLVTMGNTLISGTYTPEQVREFARSVLDTFPEGLVFEITGMTSESDRVAVEATSRGTHVSGALYENFYHFLLTWGDDGLKEMKEYLDTEVVTQVLCGGRRPDEKPEDKTTP